MRRFIWMALICLGLHIPGTFHAIAKDAQPVADTAQSPPRVLFVGVDPNADHVAPYHRTGPAATRYPDLMKERTPAFESFLKEHFESVRVVFGDQYEPKMSDRFDVTVFDTLPPYLEASGNDKNTKKFRLPTDFSRPAIMIGDVAPFIIGRNGWGMRLDHLCTCLDAHAHGMRLEHDVFRTPHRVNVSLQDLPIADSYKIYPSGSQLGETMPMWRVQTEGYTDETGMLIGTVSQDLSDSPDGEVISGGKNMKGPTAMAIGRQGSILHWGFAASPTHMTDEAKLAFVNSIHYIRKFEGHLAFAPETHVSTRDSLDFILYQLTDQGAAAWKAYTAKSANDREEAKQKILARKRNGEQLSDMDRIALTWAVPTWDQTDALERFPEDLRNEFGQDISRYIDYYTKNRPYLYSEPGVRFGPLQVDEDAKALGVGNEEIALLEKCVELLQTDPTDQRALRLLRRYTNESFDQPDDWKAWLDLNRELLFFSEHAGFKFLIDINQARSRQRGVGSPAAISPDAMPATNVVAETAIPTPAQPITFQASIVKAPTAADSSHRLVVKFSILKDWHMYSSVPPGEPYVPATIEMDLSESIEVVGDWEMSDAKPSNDNFQVTIWENECVFTRKLRLLEYAKTNVPLKPTTLKLRLTYQACNDQQCMRPVAKNIQLTLPQ